MLQEDLADLCGDFGRVGGGEGGGRRLNGEKEVGEEVVAVEVSDRFLLAVEGSAKRDLKGRRRKESERYY